MSIYASYRRLTPGELQQLLDDPAAAEAVGLYDAAHPPVFEDDDDWVDRIVDLEEELEQIGRLLDIQREWHALHFLLTGRVEMDTTEEPPPMGNVVLGGTPTIWEATYGMKRLLTPAEVREVATALQAMREDDLRQRDLKAFSAVELYGYSGHPWSAEDLERLIGVFRKVRDFFAKAAAAGDVVLLSHD